MVSGVRSTPGAGYGWSRLLMDGLDASPLGLQDLWSTSWCGSACRWKFWFRDTIRGSSESFRNPRAEQNLCVKAEHVGVVWITGRVLDFLSKHPFHPSLACGSTIHVIKVDGKRWRRGRSVLFRCRDFISEIVIGKKNTETCGWNFSLSKHRFWRGEQPITLCLLWDRSEGQTPKSLDIRLFFPFLSPLRFCPVFSFLLFSVFLIFF